MSTRQGKKTAERGKKAPSVAQGNITAAAPAAESQMNISEDERRRMVAEAAYYRAQQRGFTAGSEVDDWLEAEREITQQFRSGGARHDRKTIRRGGNHEKAEMSARPS
jgi:hypothetical protein